MVVEERLIQVEEVKNVYQSIDPHRHSTNASLVASVRRSTLRWLLPLAFLHGLLYLAIVPPWQHYDEPPHFEYARMIALLGKQPRLDEVDRMTNRLIVDSMYRFQFYPAGLRPDIIQVAPPDIGYNQKVHPPLYYAFISLPIHWFQYLSIETQLYVARMISVLLYTLTIMCAWRIATLLVPNQPALHLILPLMLMSVPAFSDMMSAVNNDVLVNFAITSLLLGCVWLIRDGWHPTSFILMILGFAVGLSAKRTAVVTVGPFLLTIFWMVVRHPTRQWMWWGIALVVGSLCTVSTFQFVPHSEGDRINGWLSVRPWLATLDQHYLRLGIDSTIRSLTNWEQSRAVYPVLLHIAFVSFWQRFGWGNVLMGSAWDLATLIVFLLGWSGLVSQVIRVRQMLALWQKRCIWLFVCTVLLAWLALIVRLHPLPAVDITFYIPHGRYMHFALLPTLWLLLIGFQGLVPRRWQYKSMLVLLGFFVCLDINVWMNILIDFYYR